MTGTLFKRRAVQIDIESLCDKSVLYIHPSDEQMVTSSPLWGVFEQYGFELVKSTIIEEGKQIVTGEYADLIYDAVRRSSNE